MKIITVLLLLAFQVFGQITQNSKYAIDSDADKFYLKALDGSDARTLQWWSARGDTICLFDSTSSVRDRTIYFSRPGHLGGYIGVTSEHFLKKYESDPHPKREFRFNNHLSLYPGTFFLNVWPTDSLNATSDSVDMRIGANPFSEIRRGDALFTVMAFEDSMTYKNELSHLSFENFKVYQYKHKNFGLGYGLTSADWDSAMSRNDTGKINYNELLAYLIREVVELRNEVEVLKGAQ